jgi:hypothetical protein
MKMSFRRRWHRLVRNVRWRMGWRHCRHCRQFSRIKWIKDVVLFADEPPMFYHLECTRCGARTAVMPTCITESAARSLGFDSFDDYSKKVSQRDEPTA